MAYLVSLYADSEASAAVVWHCFQAFKLGDQLAPIKEGTEYLPSAINGATKVTISEAIKDFSSYSAITEAISGHHVSTVVANKLGDTEPQLFGLRTYYEPLPSVAEACSRFKELNESNRLQLGKGTARLIERFEQGHFDYPATKAFNLGLVNVAKVAYPVYGYGRAIW